ncbi:MAG TPA: response regulator, partial [Pirellulales bacterium]|nr:response regulator [Pirellulales bacterium]
MPRILIVEDNPIEAREICFFIRGAGLDCDVATDAEQGFESLRTGRYDLLLADLHLPGENGFRLCRRVKRDEQLSHLPVVVLTRFADPLNVLRGLEAGADGFISKGQQPDEIIERLHRILRRTNIQDPSDSSSAARVVFLQTEFQLDASRNQLLEVLLAGFEDAVCLNQKYEKEVAAHAMSQKSVRDLTVLYQSLVETLPLGIIRKDLEGRYTFANEPFCEQLHMPREQIIGKTDAELFPETMAGQYRQDDEAVLKSGAVLDRVQACDAIADGPGRYIQIRRAPLRNSKNEWIGIQGIVSDVTEMKLAEQQLVVLNQSLEERVA